ncbi:MAG: hypothetical protein LBC37_02625 [Zoogloeaceae bacterium]|jgi:hypothetical protein|nr:hypothetical protein [Zoogloeaceae bacterium]
MSGPKTGEVILVRGVLLRAARAAQRQRRQQGAITARAEQRTDLRQTAEALSARCARLAGLLREDAALPDAPKETDLSDWAAHVRQLEALCADREARLLARAKVSVAEDRARTALAAADDAQDAEGIMTLYLEARRAKQDEAASASWQAWVEATLARLAVLPGGEEKDNALPAHLEVLARMVIAAKTPARAELLADELRREIQLHRQARAQAAADSAQAAEWLETLTALEDLDNAGDEDLRLALQAVISGRSPLDAPMRKRVGAHIAALEADTRAREIKAAAVVLAQSLQDLGYRVEDVRETLFAEGGMVHFQRPGWGGHYVRLRVNAKDRSLNFNVVRATAEAANSKDASSEQQRQDFMAEERWCAEFPRLMATLAARGMEMNLTRHLPAGELPVQEVAAERLPDLAREDQEKIRRHKKSRQLPL